MTYVDDDDFDEIEADRVEDEMEEDDAGRCDECGLAVKKDDTLVCPACTAMYHQWCVTECNRCKTTLKAADDVDAPRPGRRVAPKAATSKVAQKKRAAPKITRSR